MNDFTVISNNDARKLAALEHFFRKITQEARTNAYHGQNGLTLVEIRNILLELPADVLMEMEETVPPKPAPFGEKLPGTHDFK